MYKRKREVSVIDSVACVQFCAGKQFRVVWCVQSPQPDSQAETHLVDLLDFDKFALIKMLVQNRLKIVWCMRLNRAQNDEEHTRIQVQSACIPYFASLPMHPRSRPCDVCNKYACSHQYMALLFVLAPYVDAIDFLSVLHRPYMFS